VRGESAELAELHRVVGVRVKEARLARGLSQQRLADLARIHRTYLGDIEQGQRNPSLDVLWRLARGCEVELTYLLRPGPGDS